MLVRSYENIYISDLFSMYNSAYPLWQFKQLNGMQGVKLNSSHQHVIESHFEEMMTGLSWNDLYCSIIETWSQSYTNSMPTILKTILSHFRWASSLLPRKHHSSPVVSTQPEKRKRHFFTDQYHLKFTRPRELSQPAQHWPSPPPPPYIMTNLSPPPAHGSRICHLGRYETEG